MTREAEWLSGYSRLAWRDEAPDKSSGKRRQKIHIECDLVGFFPVDELIRLEQA